MLSLVKSGFCDVISDSWNSFIFFSYASYTMEFMSVYTLQDKMYVALLSTTVTKAAIEYQLINFLGFFSLVANSPSLLNFQSF